MSETRRGCQSVPNVNIPERKTIALVLTCQEKRRRQPIKPKEGKNPNPTLILLYCL